MIFKIRIITILLSLLLSSIYIFANSYSAELDNPEAKIATLHGFRLNKASITFTIQSNGCSRAEDFAIDYTGNKGEGFSQGDGFSILIMRTKPDLCRRMPFQKNIQLPLPGWSQNQALFVLNGFTISSFKFPE